MYPKTVTTEIGKINLRVPRGRNATFEPVTVPKGERRFDGLAANVISLYAKGMTTADIQAHLAPTYGTDISRDTISRITDAVLDDMVTWQSSSPTRGRKATSSRRAARCTSWRGRPPGLTPPTPLEGLADAFDAHRMDPRVT